MNNSQRLAFLICIVLVLATCLIYAQVAGFQFLNYDDGLYVTANSHVASGLNRSSVRWAMTGVVNDNWQPMVWLSYMLDSQLWGLNAGAFHITNLLLHIANTLLMMILLYKMTGSLWKSAFVTAIFALHPLHVESVAWVSERKDVLSTLFWLLTMLAYVGYVKKPGVCRYLLVVIVFALGLTAKPMLITLPIILLLLDYWPLGRLRMGGSQPGAARPLRFLIVEKLPLVALSIGTGVIALLTREMSEIGQQFCDVTIGMRAANSIYSLIVYLRKMILPYDLIPFYTHPGASLPSWQVIGSAVLVVAITWCSLRSRKYPYLTVGWLWYLISLLPVIELVQVGMHARADRYTYVPMTGIAIMIAWGVPDVISRMQKQNSKESADKAGQANKMVGIVAVAVIAAFAACSYQQISYWRDSMSLFNYTVNTDPNNYVGHNNLGVALMSQSKDEAALKQFRKAVKIEPRCLRAQRNLCNQLYITGHTDDAIDQIHKMLELYPHEERGYLMLGMIYLRQSKLDLAEKYIEQALYENPNDAKAHQGLGVLLLKKGKIDEAIAQISIAAKLSPRDPAIQDKLKYARSLKAETQ